MTSARTAMHFRVRGMSCAEEVVVLKRELGPLAGGEDKLAFDILNGKMTVSAAVTPQAVIDVVDRTGMTAEPWQDGAAFSPRNGSRTWNSQTVLTTTSGVATLAGFAWHCWQAGGLSAALGSEGLGLAHAVPAASRVLYALAILSGGWHIAPKAWLAARRFRPDMNLLMTIAVLGAMAIG